MHDGTVLLSPMLLCGKCDENAAYRGQKRGWFCNRLSAVYALCQFFAETQVDEKDVYLSSMIIIRPQVQIEFTPTAVFSRIGGGGGGNRERRLKDLTVLPPAREYLHLCVDEDILEDKSMGWEN